MNFDHQKYGQILSKFIDLKKLNTIGQGKEDKNFEPLLKNLDLGAAFSPHRIVNTEFARACLSALWLHHDFLTESHSISQTISNQSGSFWHGIMHRREGDYWNSKYWFQRVGSHPIYTNLATEVKKLTTSEKLEGLIDIANWDPIGFIDLCERYFKSGSLEEEVCEKIQRIEWQLLFDFCYENAISR